MTLIDKCKKKKVEDVFEVMNMEDDARTELLGGLSQSQLMDVARACNRFPCISLDYKVQNEGDLRCGASARIVVRLGRDAMDDETNLGPVFAPYYPKEKEESWWLVVGGPNSALVAIKRITITKASVNVKLDVELGEEAGDFDYTLYLMSDSYQGCDQEYNFKLKVKP
jgi:pre-mRNA-splicing helicase BRR2